MSFVIRKATLEDANSLADILSRSWMSSYKDIIPTEELEKHASLERRRKRFETLLAAPENNVYILIHENVPCGEIMFCSSRDEDLADYGEIVSIYLLEEYWGKGLGKALMSFALEKMQENNCRNYLLWAFKENARAIRFYEKFGFTADGTEKVSAFSNQAIEVRYRLDLGTGR